VLDTSARLLRLLSVLQARSHWTGPDLAARLEVTARTLRRDVDRLRSLGYAVEATSGPGGGYRLGKGSRMPPLLLGDDEAVAVAVALRAAADTFVLGETALGVLVKLDQLLPSRLKRRAFALHEMTVNVKGAPPSFDPETLTTIAAACRDHELLTFSYQDRGGAITTRVVEPLRLALTGNRRFYLLAWDTTRDDWRTFRVDRIDGRPAAGARFVPREPPEDIARYVSDAITRATYRLQARLKLRGAAAALAKTIPPWCGRLTPIDARHTELATGADTLEALVCQMVLAGVDFELLEPLDLLPQIRAIAARLTRAVGAPRRKRA
jgi:predicted DNA-binding transcriptional regulator YafY